MVFQKLLNRFQVPAKLEQEGIVGFSEKNTNIPASLMPIDGTSTHSQNVSTPHHLESTGLDTLTTPRRSPLKASESRVSMAHHVESLGRVAVGPTKLGKASESRVSEMSMRPQNNQFGLLTSAIHVEGINNNISNPKHATTTGRATTSISSLLGGASPTAVVSDTRLPSGPSGSETTEPSLSNDRTSMAENVSHFDNFSRINANHSRNDPMAGAMQDRIDPPREGDQTESVRSVVQLSNESEAPERILPEHDPSDISNSDAHDKTAAANPAFDALGNDSSRRLSRSTGSEVQQNQAIRRSSRRRRPTKKVEENYSDFADIMDTDEALDSGPVDHDAKQVTQTISEGNDHINPISEAKTNGKRAQKIVSSNGLKIAKKVDRQIRLRGKRQSLPNDRRPGRQSPTPNSMSEVSDPEESQDGRDSNLKASDDAKDKGPRTLELLKIALQCQISNTTSEDCDAIKIGTKKHGKRKASGKNKAIGAAQTAQSQNDSLSEPTGEGSGPDEEGNPKKRSKQKVRAKDLELEAPGKISPNPRLAQNESSHSAKTPTRNSTRKRNPVDRFAPIVKDFDEDASLDEERSTAKKVKTNEAQVAMSPNPGLDQNESLQSAKTPTRNSTRKRIPVDRFAPIVKDFDEDASLEERSTIKKVKVNEAAELSESRVGGMTGIKSRTRTMEPKIKGTKKTSPKSKGKQDGVDKVQSSNEQAITITTEVSTRKLPPQTGGDQDGVDSIQRIEEEGTAMAPEMSINGEPPRICSDTTCTSSYLPFVLQRDPNPTYIEEIAHLYHNPPLPSDETNGVLPRDLEKIPPPPQVPKPPSTGMCNWTYHESNRVYLGVFKASETIKCGIHPVDKEFLLSLLERNDITVITEGLLDWNLLNPDIWNLDNILNEGSYEFSHKIRRFDKVMDASGVDSVVECDGFYSMRLVDYVRYLNQRQRSYEEESSTSNTFSWMDFKGDEKSVDVQVSALYLVDIDITKYLPGVADDFRKAFRLESILPGGQDCMMNQVPRDARPTMGPNMYVTPSSSFTHFHQDGHGSVDSGHLVISGYNEVVMLRRLTERHKRHALWILTGKTSPDDTASQKYFDGLYSEPHEDGLGPKPLWPSPSLIQECQDMGYCPSVFILKPGQHLHINKGRLHAFRKMTTSKLPETDCHSALRANLIREKEITTEQLCVSIAWDWMFRGKTPRGINREVVVALEASTLNRKKGKLSLGIPEMSLLRMAQTYSTPLAQGSGILGNFANTDNRSCEKEHSAICRGILPGLRHIISGHIATMNAATCKQGSLERGERISFASRPNSWENPATFGIDPYGNEDFACKLCSKELSNVYFHCDGCERLLSKDFNICADCYNEKRFMMNVKMHPHNPKKHATINHTGGNRYDRNSRCPCKNGPCCHDCRYCLGCSCRCHTWFTLNYRFFTKEAEEALLQKVESMAQKWKEDKDADEYLDDPEYVSRRLLKSCSCW